MIRLECLGGFRVFRDEEALPAMTGKPQRAALLVYLAVEREVTREKLCGVFWPESGPGDARHALSNALYELRRDLGEGWMESIGGYVRATEGLSTDLPWVLEAADGGSLRDAVEAYTGPFLDGVALGGGAEFEQWAEGKRRRIHSVVRLAWRNAVVAASRPDERVRLARTWVRIDPLDDEGQHALIESLAMCGDRSGALDQFRAYSELLASADDLRPLDHTVALIQQIKAGELVSVDTHAVGPGAETRTAWDGTPPSGDEDTPVRLGPGLSVLRLIGRGATGSVYLAREPALRRLVAVKVLDAELALNPTARARFEREAQSAARIVHPHVATVHQVGTTDDGRPYLVMAYVKGGTLADRLGAHGPLPPHQVRRFLAEAASALAAAHAVGVIHRDVRPGNFLYDEGSGRTYLTDFGIAGVLESGTEEIAPLTRTGELLGRAEYVSPEQARGDALDDRSDVYSLGVLGRALLFGHPLFHGGTPAESSDPELVELLRRATSKEARHRPSAAELTEALERSTAPEPSRGWVLLWELRRRRVLPILGAYVAAALATMGIVDQLVQQQLLASTWYRIALALVVTGFAGAIVVAWFHGMKGRQRISRFEIALLVIIASVWLIANVLILS